MKKLLFVATCLLFSTLSLICRADTNVNSSKTGLKIAYMGSSVCSGTGAVEDKGYAFMYTNLLKERYDSGIGANWSTVNISIGGNTTRLVLDRWERDLLNTNSDYVLYGLSLGNERFGTTTEVAFETYQTGMTKLIEQAKAVNITPVVANNYANGGFDEDDYKYIKELNILMHQWDVPTINTLGAIDDGTGKWAKGYENDPAHPNTAGHEEFFYAMVPSLFDALKAGKTQPELVTSGGSLNLGRKSGDDGLQFTPEHIVHPFTISFEVKPSSAGVLMSFEEASGIGYLTIDKKGKMTYTSPKGGKVECQGTVKIGEWNRLTLSHYYAQGSTQIYINKSMCGEIDEKLLPGKFKLGGSNAPKRANYRQLFFWRSGMNVDEIEALNDGKMLKSSLEIYASLDAGNKPFVNLAQSMNTLCFR